MARKKTENTSAMPTSIRVRDSTLEMADTLTEMLPGESRNSVIELAVRHLHYRLTGKADPEYPYSAIVPHLESTYKA